jgi:hypothetical protein
MKRRLFFSPAAAALGAALLTGSALAQQPATPANPANANRRPPMSSEDRAALIDARIAGVKAGLKLTAEQEKLWPPVEAAARDMAKQAQDNRAKRATAQPKENPVERMARMGDEMTQRGTAMTKVATAARPLYASLSDDQKRRLGILMHPAGMQRGERGGHGMMQGHHREHHHRNDQR